MMLEQTEEFLLLVSRRPFCNRSRHEDIRREAYEERLFRGRDINFLVFPLTKILNAVKAVFTRKAFSYIFGI